MNEHAQAIIDKSNRGIFKSKKMIMALIVLGCSLVVFGAGLYGIIKLHGEGATAIVNLATVTISCISGMGSAIILGVNILDFHTTTSIENIAKSETIHNITETIEKTLRPKDVDDGSTD